MRLTHRFGILRAFRSRRAEKRLEAQSAPVYPLQLQLCRWLAWLEVARLFAMRGIGG